MSSILLLNAFMKKKCDAILFIFAHAINIKDSCNILILCMLLRRLIIKY